MDRGAGACATRTEHARAGQGQAEPGREASPDGPGAPGLRHTAALVRSPGEGADVAAAAVEEGLFAGDLTVLAGAPDRVDAVRRALGGRVGAVEDDPRVVLLGARAPDATAAVRQLVERAAGSSSGRLRVIAQPDFQADPRRWREIRRYEAASNELCAGAPVTALCVYDEETLPADAVDTARLTHPELVSGGVREASPRYLPPAACLRGLAGVREPVEAAAPVWAVDGVPTLPALRSGLRRALAAVVPDPDLLADLHLAVSEVAANAFRHGRPPVSARVWADGSAVVCRVTDSGAGFDDPFAGFLPAHGDDLGAGGMGLWLARKLWDSVDLVPGPAGGFTVRLATTLPRPGGA